MTQDRRPAELPPGPARSLVDLLRRLAATGRQKNASIARRAQLSPSYVSEVLNGRKAPTPAVAARLAAALNGSGADELQARVLAEQVQDLRQYERARVAPAATAPRAENAAYDLWSVCLAFTLAIDAAHNALRAVARGEGAGDLLTSGNAALQEAGVYTERERLIAAASPEVVAAGEAVFFALVAVRDAVRTGADLESPAYHRAYHRFAEQFWLFRMAVRAGLGHPALSAATVHRANWSDRDRCARCADDHAAVSAADTEDA